MYQNGLLISVKLRNSEGDDVYQADIDRVLVNPTHNKYPVTLRNTDTNEEYCAIIDGNNEKPFGYMYPGRYEVICSNNMYMNLDELREINSDSVIFTQQGGKYYVEIPKRSSYGEYQETTDLTDWRGYSSLSVSMANYHPDVDTHVSFYAKALVFIRYILEHHRRGLVLCGSKCYSARLSIFTGAEGTVPQ